MTWIQLSKCANVPKRGKQSSERCTASSTGILPIVLCTMCTVCAHLDSWSTTDSLALLGSSHSSST